MFGLRRWKKIRRLLKSSRGFDLSQERDDSGLSCLAFALGNAAPTEVIQDMVSLDPSLARAKDMFGASSLHVACLNGASVEGVQYILSYYNDLAWERDDDQRGALHHAVEYACQSGDEHYSYEDVISLLCKTAPEMVNSSDKEGDTPIDLVQLVKVDITEKSREYARLHRIYVLLRDTSINLYRENRRRWELEGCVRSMHLTDHDHAGNIHGITVDMDNPRPGSSVTSFSFTSGHGTGTGTGATNATSESINSFERRKKGFKRSLRDR